MPNSTQDQSVQQTQKLIIEDAVIWLEQGIDTLSQLEALFNAIGKECGEHTEIHKLAMLGKHVAFDIGNGIDVAREDFEGNKHHLMTMCQQPGDEAVQS